MSNGERLDRAFISCLNITAIALAPRECIHLRVRVLEQDVVHGVVMFLKREASEAETWRACNGPDFFGYACSAIDKKKTSGVNQQPSFTGAGQAPSPHTQAELATTSTAQDNTLHNSENVDMGNEDREHEQIIEIINRDVRIGLFGTLGGLIASKDYFKAALCASTIAYPMRNLPLASSG